MKKDEGQESVLRLKDTFMQRVRKWERCESSYDEWMKKSFDALISGNHLWLGV